MPHPTWRRLPSAARLARHPRVLDGSASRRDRLLVGGLTAAFLGLLATPAPAAGSHAASAGAVTVSAQP